MMMMLGPKPRAGLGNGGGSGRAQNGGGGGRHRLLLLFLAAVAAGCALSGLPLLLRSTTASNSSSMRLGTRLRHRWLPTTKAAAAARDAAPSSATTAAAETGSSRADTGAAAATGAAAPLQGVGAAGEGAASAGGGAGGGPDAGERGAVTGAPQPPPEAAPATQQQPLIPSYGWARWRWKWQPADGAAAHEPTAPQLGRQEANATAGDSSAGGLPPDVDQPSQLVITLSQHKQASLRATTAAAAPIQQPTTAAAQEPDDLQRLLGERQAATPHSSIGSSGQLNGTAAAAAAEVWPPGVVDAADATSPYILARGVPPVHLKWPLWWHGPIWAGSGYGSEAVNFVLSLLRTGRLAPADLHAYHHGDGWRRHVVDAMAPADRLELEHLQSLPVRYRHVRPAVVVCHSVPTNWAYPELMSLAGAPCPPNPKEFSWVYAIGRTMFETDRLPQVFVPRLNAMNEVWVPSEWQRQSFIASGVEASKLFVVPEGVNTTLYDPARYTPLDITAKAQLVFGRTWGNKTGQLSPPPPPAADSGGGSNQTSSTSTTRGEATQGDGGGRGDSSSAAGGSSGSSSSSGRRPFRFVSTFKWEERKGWSILLEAYLTAFTAEDDVELFILTQPFGASGSSFKEKMRGWAERLSTRNNSSSSSSSKATGRRTLLAGAQQPHGPAAELAAHVGRVVADMHGLAAGVPLPPGAARKLAGLSLQQQQQQQQEAGGDGAAPVETAAAPAGSPPAPRNASQEAADAAAAASKAAAAAQAAAAAAKAAALAAAKEAAAAAYPTLYVVNSHISDADFPRFYKAGDAFVLPSRGEGWGRPHVEAMSMGLPVIATNWSGITAYLDEAVGYPLAIDGLVSVGGSEGETVWWFRGLRWAQPSVAHLVTLMQRVYHNREEAAAKGAAARAKMQALYSPEAIADVLVAQLERVQDRVP